MPCFHADGLWPDKNDGTWSACCPGKRFDIREVLYQDCLRMYVNALPPINWLLLLQISKLLSIMNKYWPSYSCESVSNCHGGTGLFWEHEVCWCTFLYCWWCQDTKLTIASFVMSGIFGSVSIWRQWGKDLENFSSPSVNNNFPFCLTKKFVVLVSYFFLSKL